MTLVGLLRHLSLKHIRLQRAQTFMTVAGICLGVAAMVSIDIVNKSVIHSFEDSINRITGRAALQVTGAESGFPEEILERVQSVEGVAYAVPVIEANASLSEGTERSIMILGVDVLQDYQVRDYSITDENADIPDPLLFLAKPDSIIITRALADREGLRMDQKIRVQTVQGIKTFKVRGLLNPEGPAKAAGGDIAIMDIYAAQMAFGKEGKIDRIDISLLPEEGIDSAKKRVQAVLPAGYSVDTPAGRSRQIEMLLTRFRKSIGLIGFMAMFVGMYLIYNAVSISVIHRRKEIGILRALGATRGQILRLFLGETFIIASFGSLLGIGLGILFAKMTIGVVAQSITDIYLKATISELSFSWKYLAADFSLGILASLITTLLPARAASRVTPVSAIRALPYSTEGTVTSLRLAIASGFCIVIAGAIFLLYRSMDPSSVIRSADTVFWTIPFLLLGVSLSMPLFLGWFLQLFHRCLSGRLGAESRLAGLNLQKNISRNAVAAAAVFYSISLFVSSGSVIFSSRKSMYDFVDSQVRSDIMVSSGHPLAVGGAPNIPMPLSLGKDMEKMPGVLSADPLRKIHLNYQGSRILLWAADAVRWGTHTRSTIAEGSGKDILPLLTGGDNIVINENFAARYGVKPGDSVVLPTPGGPVRFGIAAIILDYSSDSGVVKMDLAVFRRHWRDSLADMFSVNVMPGFDVSQVRESLLQKFGRDRKLFALSAKEFKDEVLKMVDRSFTISNAVTILTMIVAAFGIIVTLLASVLERTREIGILRSIGMRRREVSRLVVIESMLLGSVGGLVGSVIGVLIGWISLEAFVRLDYGASVSFQVEYSLICWALLLSLGLSALAGLYPAVRASNTNIVEALSYE